MAHAITGTRAGTPVACEWIVFANLGIGVKALCVAAAATVVTYGVHFWRPVLVPVLLAICVAAASQPVFDAARRRGLPNSAAVMAAMAVVVAAVVGFATLLAMAGADLAESLPVYERALRRLQLDIATFFQRHHMARLSYAVVRYDVGSEAVGALSRSVTSVAEIAAYAGLVMVLAAFFLVERALAGAKLARLAGAQKALHVARRAMADVQQYLWIKTLISAATGVLVWTLCAALRVPGALTWGLLAFALNYAPNVGSLIAAIPPILLGLALRGPAAGASLVLGFAAINLALGNVIEPKVMGRRLGLSPAVVVVAMLAWGYLLGPVGALVSTPLTMIFKIVIGYSDDLRFLSLLLGDAHEKPPATRNPPPLSRESSVRGEMGAL